MVEPLQAHVKLMFRCSEPFGTTALLYIHIVQGG